MKYRLCFLSIAMLAIAASVTSCHDNVTANQPNAGTSAAVKPAPAFTAQTAAGKTVKLSDYKGKIVVLEWYNHDCPFVRKMYDSGKMQQLQKNYTQKGVIWLQVISSAPGKQGYMTAQQALKNQTAEKSAATATILDPSGKIGKLYDAKTTPDMVIIDAKGNIVYQGAIDNKPSTKVADVQGANNYVEENLNLLLAGKPVAQSYVKPYGCSVKYAT